MIRDHADVLIVGGGLAAQRTCETLRRLGYDGRVRVICEEPYPPYDRPPLSKTVLTGERDTEPPSLRPNGWYADNEIELLLASRAAALDPTTRLIRLEDGARLRYGTLVIATGSRPRRLEPLPLGERVRELRTIDDARALREALTSSTERIAIVGAGLVGMEVASSAMELGVAVTMIEAAPTPLARILPPLLGDWLARLHARAGVEVLLQSTVDRIRIRAGDLDLTLNDGRRIRADLVLVAAGTTPATAWLADSGLPSSGAIPVDTSGRTAIPGIHSAGDAASFFDPRPVATRRPSTGKRPRVRARSSHTPPSVHRAPPRRRPCSGVTSTAPASSSSATPTRPTASRSTATRTPRISPPG
jgi:3-phenylpropionate/trans-cinnamate dioxygenase ferredoxin reductase subunit